MPSYEVNPFSHLLRAARRCEAKSAATVFPHGFGAKWKPISDWIAPEKELVRAKVELLSMAFAKEKGLKPRDCSKES